MQLVNARTTNWTAIPAPTAAWAALVFPGLEPTEALDRLWADIAHICRLDEPDPVAAWEQRAAALAQAAARLSEQRFDAIRFDGPGTELTVGLLPTSRWQGGTFTTVDGIVHLPNLPTEEVFTAPDPARVDGVVRATKPLLIGGTSVEGLRVRFEAGEAIAIEADAGGDVLAAMTRGVENGTRLGEIALVDREGRIGPLRRVFSDTLLDENAASHIALGAAYAFTVGEEDRGRINVSQIHVDFMIGGDDVAVTGVRGDGTEVPVLRGGAWQL
jgi:aminopeptidase